MFILNMYCVYGNEILWYYILKLGVLETLFSMCNFLFETGPQRLYEASWGSDLCRRTQAEEE